MSKDSDTAVVFNALREERRGKRQRLGLPCPECRKREPKRHPTILLPAQRCYCGYRDPRAREDTQS